MAAFYFDVGGVLIPDKFSPERALDAFRELAPRHGFKPEAALATYTKLQPSLDLGTLALTDFCAALGADRRAFERDWLAMHPVDGNALHVVERLLAAGHAVGLATNFCRQLLNLLIERTSVLSRLAVCCSSDIGVAKPSAEFFRHANRIMHSDETVFIDDRLPNVQAAQEFGWTVFHATDGWSQRLTKQYIDGAT